MKVVGNSFFQKAANSSLILNYLRTHSPCSRQQMAASLGLQPSTVSYITGRMLNAGLVEEYEEKQLSRKKGSGRRPVGIRINPSFGYVIGLDLQVDYYCAVVCDVSGQVLQRTRKDYQKGNGGFQKLLTTAMDEVCKKLNPNIPVLGTGLAIPGIVNRETGFVKECWTHKLENVDLSSFLEESFGFPVMIENDANCCAQNILWNHARQEDESFIYLLSRFHNRTLLPEENVPSIGIGLGMALNGRLYTGISHEAGEYQSILFSRERQLKWQLSLSDEEMDRALYDPVIRKDIIRELMGNMILILQVLNPRALYIGGDLSTSGALVQSVLEENYSGRWKALQNKGCRLEMVEQGDFDPARGAAACFFTALYAIPQVGSTGNKNKKWKTILENILEEKKIYETSINCEFAP